MPYLNKLIDKLKQDVKSLHNEQLRVQKFIDENMYTPSSLVPWVDYHGSLHYTQTEIENLIEGLELTIQPDKTEQENQEKKVQEEIDDFDRARDFQDELLLPPYRDDEQEEQSGHVEGSE